MKKFEVPGMAIAIVKGKEIIYAHKGKARIEAVTVESAISEFMTSLWQAVTIILATCFISLGVRPGLVIAASSTSSPY